MNIDTHQAPTSDPVFYPLKEVMQRTTLSRSFLNRQIKRGRLPTYKVGGRRLVSAADLTAYMDSHRTPAV